MSSGAGVMPGDELIPVAPVVFDRDALLPAPAERVWPWILQLGKSRGGWYLPASLERLLPVRHRALRRIEPRFQDVKPGDRVPDYGPGGWFEARIVQPPHTLVWWSERGRGLTFSWALVLEDVGPNGSGLRIRLRMNRRPGKRAPALLERLGGLGDLITVRLMIRGLRERLARTS